MGKYYYLSRTDGLAGSWTLEFGGGALISQQHWSGKGGVLLQKADLNWCSPYHTRHSWILQCLGTHRCRSTSQRTSSANCWLVYFVNSIYWVSKSMYVPLVGDDVDCIIMTNTRATIRHTFPIVPRPEAAMI